MSSCGGGTSLRSSVSFTLGVSYGGIAGLVGVSANRAAEIAKGVSLVCLDVGTAQDHTGGLVAGGHHVSGRGVGGAGASQRLAVDGDRPQGRRGGGGGRAGEPDTDRRSQ